MYLDLSLFFHIYWLSFNLLSSCWLIFRLPKSPVPPYVWILIFILSCLSYWGATCNADLHFTCRCLSKVGQLAIKIHVYRMVFSKIPFKYKYVYYGIRTKHHSRNANNQSTTTQNANAWNVTRQNANAEMSMNITTMDSVPLSKTPMRKKCHWPKCQFSIFGVVIAQLT